MAEALDKANSQFLNNNKSPSRKAGELDTRGSHFYLAMYWAVALAEQRDDMQLNALFSPIAKQLQENEQKIVAELNGVQGQQAEIGGYFQPDDAVAAQIMRPSSTLNSIIEQI